MITNYEELPYSMYLRMIEICDTIGDSTERSTAILSVLTGKSEDELLDLPISDYAALAEKASFIGDVPAPKMLQTEYRIAGWTLKPTLKPEKMTAGQYIDFQNFGADDRHEIELLSTMLIPKGKTYCDGYEVDELQQDLRTHLMTRDALALRGFFLASSVASMPAMLHFWASRRRLTAEQRKKIREMQRTLRRSQRDGVGCLLWMLSARLAARVGMNASASPS